MIRFGDTGILNLRLGDTQCKRAYLGNVQVWPGYHYLEFWTDAHPIEDLTSWMDGTTNSGLYCVTEDVETFINSLRNDPDMTSIRDDNGNRSFPVIGVNGGSTAWEMAQTDGDVGSCYVNTDISSMVHLFEDIDGQSWIIGYAIQTVFAWDDNDGARTVIPAWVIQLDTYWTRQEDGSYTSIVAEIQDYAYFVFNSVIHTVKKGGIYLPRPLNSDTGFEGDSNAIVTREYGVEKYTPGPITATALQLHVTSELTQNLYYTQSAPNGVTIDWGDGSTVETVSDLSATATHTYADAGDYIVFVTSSDGATWSPGCTLPNPSDTTKTIDYGLLGEYDKHAVHPQLTGFLFGPGCGLDTFYAFNGCTGLTAITLPGWITQIPDYAFQGCVGITAIDIPASVAQIGTGAFDGCSLAHVRIPATVANVGSGAFGCGAYLRTVEVGAAALGNEVFWDENGVGGPADAMEKIWIRSTCTTLPGGSNILTSAFSGCDNATIYAEPSERPAGWHEEFNLVDTTKDESGTFRPLYLPVVYGQTARPW